MLCNSLDHNKHAGDLALHASLRVLRSKWSDERWTTETEESQLKRMLSLLVERVFVVETGEDTEEVRGTHRHDE